MCICENMNASAKLELEGLGVNVREVRSVRARSSFLEESGVVSKRLAENNMGKHGEEMPKGWPLKNNQAAIRTWAQPSAEAVWFRLPCGFGMDIQ